MARRWIKFSTAFGLLLLILGGSVGWVYTQFTKPGKARLDQTIVLSRGQSLEQIGSRLKKKGIISSQLVFRVGVHFDGWSQKLQAGEFRLPAGASMREVATILRNGITVVRKITVPEGFGSYDIITLLRQTEGLHGDIEEIPEEGTLLPDTYHFSYGDERRAVLIRMEKAMRKTMAGLWTAREQGLPLTTIRQAVVLASIVEKETSLPEERARIASVFINRLRRGMRLQSDPTVIYGLTNGVGSLGRPLLHADLERYTPHNTYQILGLPPTPITNPGQAALYATLHPATGKELYFVADGTGGHAFATNFTQHKRNVERWRDIKFKKNTFR